MEDLVDLRKALKLLQNECASHINCKTCPLSIRHVSCGVQKHIPADYDLSTIVIDKNGSSIYNDDEDKTLFRNKLD